MVVANSRPRTQHPQSFAALVQGRVGRRCRFETRQGGDRRTWIEVVETSCVSSRWKISGSGAVSPLPQDSQSVIDHSRRRGHSVASKHFGLWGLWLKEAQADRMMALEQVHTAANTTYVCARLCLKTSSVSCVNFLTCTCVTAKKQRVATLRIGLFLSWIGRADASVLSSLARLSLKGVLNSHVSVSKSVSPRSRILSSVEGFLVHSSWTCEEIGRTDEFHCTHADGPLFIVSRPTFLECVNHLPTEIG